MYYDVGGLSFLIFNFYGCLRLTELKQAYLICTSILLIFQVAKLAKNLFNYGAAVKLRI